MSTIQAPLTALFIFLAGFLYAQQVPIEGFVYESDNRGYLKKVHITATGSKDHKVYLDTFTNAKGVFKALLPSGKSYKVVAEKKHFFPKDTILHIPASAKKDNSFYLGIEMLRKPGYIFDVTMASKDGNIGFKESIQGARIEIYNNTTQKEELALKDYPYPNFKFTFENGNHYTIMIRKKGFFNKRMEAYINVEGCILCFEGLGLVDPGVTDVMTNNNQQGTFLANVELQPAIINKTIRINNIYYDYDQSYIRPDAAKELDKLVYILKDNPAIKIELGSHTDARGSDDYNLSLSQRRADAAVEYLIGKGIDPANISSKGYGETVLANRCDDGVPCSKEEHQYNRRTELKIIDIADKDPLEQKSLKEIIEEEKLMKEIENSPVIRGE